ncbi:MAG: glycosyltransferase, partial [Ilumatobacteraceae bacterium]
DVEDRRAIVKASGVAGLADRIDVPGLCSDEELRDLYRAAAVVVVPSLLEGFGLPALEARACGTRVLAPDLPWARDLLDAGVELVSGWDPTYCDEGGVGLAGPLTHRSSVTTPKTIREVSPKRLGDEFPLLVMAEHEDSFDLPSVFECDHLEKLRFLGERRRGVIAVPRICVIEGGEHWNSAGKVKLASKIGTVTIGVRNHCEPGSENVVERRVRSGRPTPCRILDMNRIVRVEPHESVVTESLAVLAGEREPGIITFGYSDDEAFAVGLTCGGTIRLYVEEFDW